ncbi:hypothetical protein L0F63_000495, partial [Massospora cicadina]
LSHRVKVHCTHWNKENDLFTSFKDLPTDLPRDFIKVELIKGLKEYGRVKQFELKRFHLMLELCSRKAIAVIDPKPEGKASNPFKVTPEKAPPICQHCQALGHWSHACPAVGKQQEEDPEEMDENDETFGKLQSERCLSPAQLSGMFNIAGLKAATSWAKKNQHLRNPPADILAIQE